MRHITFPKQVAQRCGIPVLLLLAGAALAGCERTEHASTTGASEVASASNAPTVSTISKRTYEKPPAGVIKQRLSALEFDVTQNEGTEPPFQNRFWNNHEPGLYVDIVSGEPLFSSRDKFESGTGWPSFTKPIDPARVVSHEDVTLGMSRTEVRSRSGDSHLGHVFDDGPAPGGLRYCINSASLRFIPVSDLQKDGYEDYLPLFKDGT